MVGAGNVLSNTLPPSKDGFRMTTVEINVEVSLDSHREKLRQCNSKIFSQGKTFTGIGPTPSIAKNIAAEAAVHHIATIMSSDPTEEELQTGRAFEDRWRYFQNCRSWYSLLFGEFLTALASLYQITKMHKHNHCCHIGPFFWVSIFSF